MRLSQEEIELFNRDGVLCLRKALDRQTLDLALGAFNWSCDNPGPFRTQARVKDSGQNVQDRANPAAMAVYKKLVKTPVFGDICRELWGCDDVWYIYEQIFWRVGGTHARTNWHQDTPFMPVKGRHLGVMWFSFDPVSRDHAVEFVRKSHKGLLYNGWAPNPQGGIQTLYPETFMPRLPDIEGERDKLPILAWATEPGDVIVFHPSVIHGGGDTLPELERRTLSLRFCGEDARVDRRPSYGNFSPDALPKGLGMPPIMAMFDAEQDAPFRHPDFIPVTSQR